MLQYLLDNLTGSNGFDGERTVEDYENAVSALLSILSGEGFDTVDSKNRRHYLELYVSKLKGALEEEFDAPYSEIAAMLEGKEFDSGIIGRDEEIQEAQEEALAGSEGPVKGDCFVIGDGTSAVTLDIRIKNVWNVPKEDNWCQNCGCKPCVCAKNQEKAPLIPDPVTPDQPPDPDPVPDQPPDPVPDPQPDPVPDPQPDPVPDPQPDPVPDPQPDPVPDPVPDPQPDPDPVPDPQPNPDPAMDQGTDP